jgi:hypothetical protein
MAKRCGRGVDTLHILEVPGSNPGPEIACPEFRFSWFSSFTQNIAGTVPKIGPQLLPSISFSIHYSLIILSFSTVKFELLAATINKLQRNMVFEPLE